MINYMQNWLNDFIKLYLFFMALNYSIIESKKGLFAFFFSYKIKRKKFK